LRRRVAVLCGSLGTSATDRPHVHRILRETWPVKTASEKLGPTRVKLTVEVPFDELKPAVEAATKKIADEVQIPGFRKGKVPTRLVEQRFGRPAIMQEAVNDAMPDFYQQAAAEAEIKPVGRPEVEITDIPGLDGTDEGDLIFVVEQDVR